MDMECYCELLHRLKVNKENISLEILKTKYQKHYSALKVELKAMTEEVLQGIVFSGLKIERCHAEAIYAEINAEIMKSGILEQIKHVVFLQQDADLVLKYADQLREIVHGIVKGREENASEK